MFSREELKKRDESLRKAMHTPCEYSFEFYITFRKLLVEFLIYELNFYFKLSNSKSNLSVVSSKRTFYEFIIH